MKNLEKFKLESLELTQMMSISGGDYINSNQLPTTEDDFSCGKTSTQTNDYADMHYEYFNDDGTLAHINDA